MTQRLNSNNTSSLVFFSNAASSCLAQRPKHLSEGTATGTKHQVHWTQYRGRKLSCNVGVRAQTPTVHFSITSCSTRTPFAESSEPTETWVSVAFCLKYQIQVFGAFSEGDNKSYYDGIPYWATLAFIWSPIITLLSSLFRSTSTLEGNMWLKCSTTWPAG